MPVNVDALFLKVNVLPVQRTQFSDTTARRKQQAEQHLIHIILSIG